MKKRFTVFLISICMLNLLSAKRLPPKDVPPLEKKGLRYNTGLSVSNDNSYFFGIISIENSEGDKKYLFTVPLYAEKITKSEFDVQTVYIKEMFFSDENTIQLTNERNEVFTFDVNTFDVKCISKDINQKEVKELYEKDFVRRFNHILEDSRRVKQSKEKKVQSLDELIVLAEDKLFSVYGEEKIKKERSYHIVRCNDFWFLWGSLEKNRKDGTFEIAIDSETSEIIFEGHGK